MKKYKLGCLCLLALIIICAGWAAAESRYDALCAQETVVQADTAAWIEIPGANFCRPIMISSEDDGFYAGHDASGAESALGALYIQSAYNSGSFSDPVTVVYGGSKVEGAPLRDLQEIYSGYFDQCRDIKLHLPSGTVEYRVFAAVPYSSIHILHYYDFSVERRYNAFFDGVYSTRLLGMHLDEDIRPQYGDNVLILSTGMRGDKMQRYLVLAKQVNN